MRKIFALALLCGLGFIPATTEAKTPTIRVGVHTGVHVGGFRSFDHVVHGRSFRFDHCNVIGRDCFRFWWEAGRRFVYWYPGATTYFVLTEAGLAPVPAVLHGPLVPLAGPTLPLVSPFPLVRLPLTGLVAPFGLPPLPAGIPVIPAPLIVR